MRRWHNWAGDQRCAPASFEEPGSEAELVEAVGRAAAAGAKLRVAGSGHSFTDTVLTDGHMLSLRRMDRVLDSDADSGLVRVEAGIRLRELGVALAERGLAMENLGDVDAQTLAGALATGTHGTGERFANLPSQVTGMRLVTASGEVIDATGSASDEDLLRAARVSIGALGVVSEVTLRCVPAYTLHRVDERHPLEETLERFEELVTSREHFEFFAIPYSRWALWRTTTAVDEPPRPPSRGTELLHDVLLENAALGAFCKLGRAVPSMVPALDRTLGRLASGGERLDRSHRIYANPRLVRFTEMEYAIPREHGAEAARRVLELVERRRLPVVFPIEVRAGAPDDAFISPGHGRDSAYIAVHVYRGTDFEAYFRAVEAIMDSYGGRPHWGKRHYQSASTLRPLYPDWERFAAVRDRLDPHRLFTNDYVERVLGP